MTIIIKEAKYEEYEEEKCKRLRRKMTKSEKDVETISGDGLSMKKESNKKLLEIKGDGCKISIARNCGTIRMIGDGCRLKVMQNFGTIEYFGDGGRVDLGPESSTDKVTFVGHGSHVKILNEKQVKSSRGLGHVQKENKDDILLQLKNEDKKPKKDCLFQDVDDDYRRVNERRDMRRLNESKCEKGSTVTVTKIVNANGECKTSVRTFYKNVDPTRC